jgi:hypothetical protein
MISNSVSSYPYRVEVAFNEVEFRQLLSRVSGLGFRLRLDQGFSAGQSCVHGSRIPSSAIQPLLARHRFLDCVHVCLGRLRVCAMFAFLGLGSYSIRIEAPLSMDRV